MNQIGVRDAVKLRGYERLFWVRTLLVLGGSTVCRSTVAIRAVGLAIATVLLSCGPADVPTGPGSGGDALAPVFQAPSSSAIPNQYRVLVRSGGNAQRAADDLTGSSGDTLIAVAPDGTGFTAVLSSGSLDAARRDERVESLLQDEFLTSGVSHPFFTQIMDANGDPWGLDRVDQNRLPLNRQYNYTETGVGVTVYVIDSGIDTKHSDFGGRATVRFLSPQTPACPEDEDGHGTEVAAIVGGNMFGVAKALRLVGLRVFRCGAASASGSLIVDALKWIRANASGPSAVVMSLGVKRSGPVFGQVALGIEAEVQAVVAHGVPVIVAAGNDNDDACLVIPARSSAAVTTSATTATDARRSDANHGACVDIFAPGDAITTARVGGGAVTHGGTSLAAPHVAGIVALHLEANPGSSPAEIQTELLASASIGELAQGTLGPGSPDRLVFMGLIPKLCGTPVNTSTVLGTKLLATSFEQAGITPFRANAAAYVNEAVGGVGNPRHPAFTSAATSTIRRSGHTSVNVFPSGLPVRTLNQQGAFAVPGVVTSAVLDCVFDVSAYSFVELSFFLHWAVGYHPNCRAELDFFIRLDSGPWGSLGPICPGAPTVTPPWQRISLGILTHGARTLEIGYNATVLLNPTTELTAFVAIDDLVVTGLHP